MPNLTPNFGLTKPLPEEFYDVGVQNANMDIIDEELQKVAAGGKRTARFTIGASAAGWTADQCDYLCDGIADNVEINAAIQALPSTGGEIVLLNGTYEIAAEIKINKTGVTLRGNGASTKLVRAYDGGRIIYVSYNKCVVENLYVDGAKGTYTDDSNTAIYVLASDVVIRNNVVENNQNYGIYLGNPRNKAIDNIVKTSYAGIVCGDDCNIVTGNSCFENDKYGIDVGDKFNVVTGNVCRLNGVANFYMYYAEYNVITANNFAVADGDSVTPKAIYMYGSYCTGNIVTDNQVGTGVVDIGSNTGNVVATTPAIAYGTTDIEAGSASTEPEGSLHFVIE